MYLTTELKDLSISGRLLNLATSDEKKVKKKRKKKQRNFGKNPTFLPIFDDF